MDTTRDYRRPHRPWPIKLLNRLPLPPRGLLGLDPDTLIASARAAEGLEDFGEPPVLPLLRRLCEAYEDEARLSQLGRFIAHDRLSRLLRSRLRAVELRRRHPEIDAIDVSNPVVITGLPRTGTTVLQRMLAADVRLRHLRTWEALVPAPPRTGRDRRIAGARQAQLAMRYLTPDLYATHAVQADGVEEEILLLDHALLSTVSEATCRMPAYSRWLTQQDPLPAYKLMEELLQLLIWQGPTGRWLLKTPHHMEWLDTLHEVFPGAVVLHTHRDPKDCVASFCSMVAHGYGLSSDEVDPIELGDQWLDKTGYMVDRALDARERGAVSVHDVLYNDIVHDPVAVLTAIYEAIDLEPPANLEQQVTRTRRNNPQHAHGRHRYALEDFGLDEARITARFARYNAFRAGLE